MAPHPLGGVDVERGEHAPLVQAGQERRRVGEQLPVPGVAGPARADRRVDVGDVPVHVDDGHGEGQLLGGEAVHERQVLLVAVGVVAAPPVAQQRPRDEGARPGEAEEVPQRLLVVLAVAEDVEVLRPVGQAVAGLTGLDPLVLGEQQRGGVVQGGDAVQAQQSRAEGDGAVGLSAVLAAKSLGAERIILMGRHKDRTDLGREFGATDVVADRGEAGITQVMELTGGYGSHVVLEAVGHMPAYDQAVGVVRPGGIISRVGVPQYEEAPIGFGSLFGKNARLAGGPAPVRNYLEAGIADVLSGKINPGKVFDLTLPLEQVADAYQAMDSRTALKVMLTP